MRSRADMLLTGSVRSNAGVIRLTASLMDARMGTYVWTEAYDMPADDPVLTLQTGLAYGSRFPSGNLFRRDGAAHYAEPLPRRTSRQLEPVTFSRADALPGNRGNG